MSREELATLVTTVYNYVRYLQRLGVAELPLQPAQCMVQRVESGAPLAAEAAPQGHTSQGRVATPEVPAALRLQQLAETVRDCRQCRLHQGRRQVVFGTGNPKAALVFVGEAPGEEEDRQGEPFVGAAGQLLTRIIEAIGLQRDQVYLLNVIKCRPPNNRNPLPAELAACRPILQAQLACLQPRVICALGAFAAQALLQTEERISRLRGHFHPLGDIQVMPTYHPAYVLRNPQSKRAVWDDMQQIQRALGLR
jgi:uracil-DNA glycosylase